MADQYEDNRDPDLAAYRAAGRLRYMHKATEGRYHVDSKHRERVERAHSLGLFVNHYHFCRPDEGQDPAPEMQLFWGTCKSLWLPGDRLVLDCEAEPNGVWVGGRNYVPNAWDALLRRSGIKAAIYGSTSFLAAAVPILWLKDKDRHEAAYGPSPTNRPWHKHWWAWQFTDGASGRLPHSAPGIGLCDQSMLSMPAALADLARWRGRRQLVKGKAGK